MKRILKEPLLHFLVIGILLFAAYARLNRAGDPLDSRKVRIGEADVKWMIETWARQWQREPTNEELRGIVTDFLKEELLAREARAMGLDEGDTVVRRRLAQKMEFVVQDASSLAQPTDEQLQYFYTSHADLFRTDGQISFTQIFFNTEKRKDVDVDAKATLAQLTRGGARPADLGDVLLGESEFYDADKKSVASQFGDDFAKSIFALQPDVWSGPIKSGYGVHLVRVSELKPGELPMFAQVKPKVLERWRDEQQRADNAKYFAGLLKKYDVVVDENVKSLVGQIGVDTRKGNSQSLGLER